MSATFACPHCGATYPRKPVLVGRAVRCTTCKNAFRLREDGIADAIEMPASPAVAAAVPAAPARPIVTPLTLPPELAAPAPAPAPKAAFALDDDIEVVDVVPPAPPSPPQPARSRPSTESIRSRSDRLTAQQQDARRAMAATLATSMSAALKAESTKAESVQKTKTEAGSAEGRVGKIGPVILTGEGVQEARLRRTWLLIGLAMVMVVGGCSWLVLHRSPQRQALETYAAVVEGPRNRYDRIQAIQERAWMVMLPPANIGVPAMMDMSDARIGPPQVIKFAPLRPLFDQLKGLVFSTPANAWVPPDRLAAVEAAVRPDLREQDRFASLQRIEKRLVDYHDWQAKLAAAGLSTDAVEAIDRLLRGKTKRTGENDIAARLLGGNPPDAIELALFRGRKGTMVISHGQNFDTKPVHYEGQLLRFVGKDWPTEWRVLNITATLAND